MPSASDGFQLIRFKLIGKPSPMILLFTTLVTRFQLIRFKAIGKHYTVTIGSLIEPKYVVSN